MGQRSTASPPPPPPRRRHQEDANNSGPRWRCVWSASLRHSPPAVASARLCSLAGLYPLSPAGSYKHPHEPARKLVVHNVDEACLSCHLHLRVADRASA